MEGVGRTSIGVAKARAWESRRPDRLFDDPYAVAFTEAAALPPTPPSPMRIRLAYHVIIRTRFYDDYLLDACAAGRRQVVLLAAGLDTRAYRLDWPAGVYVFELDLPEVLSFKDRILTERNAEPRCRRTALPTDLREDWPARLLEAGFEPTRPTAWLIEGLLVYLTAEEASRLLTRVGDLSAAGSRLSMERNNAATTMHAEDRTGMEDYTSLWKGGLGPETGAWLDENGWKTETHDLQAVAESYGRPTEAEATSGFLTATYSA